MRDRFADHESFSRIRTKGAGRRAFDDDAYEQAFAKHQGHDAFEDYEVHDGYADQDYDDDSAPAAPVGDGPAEGDRWSTWDQSTPTEKGPEPRPDWVVTELAAVDTEFGIVKTGKEADVFLLERAVPGTDRRTLMAAKRYRDGQHRMFHRDSGYLEGRAHKESRVSRAMAKRTDFGKQAIAGQWAAAEFTALCRFWSAGVAVPYPVQILGTEILMEFIGDPSGTAAPRLAQLRPEEAELEDLWEQLGASLALLARDGYAHGDLSAYNILVHQGRLVVIDVPQIVDVIANPRGRSFLERDVRNVGAWFVARGLPERRVEELARGLAFEARLD
ncbi:serine protein kinase RIO [Kitasatospora kifunensis]|uniref:non-specific serine/threonine protein kinase n=1 Tax=Kitasatospora kifunensis TaxID=58351 RepID=A0A7W7R8C3_KITKI|nr:RIO1 family regulatory kinase/ATPase [Kitasatospora kifunensis]MBB4927295.1 RIO kinase 1 [Kitasatospora kifunensis]